MGFLGGYCSINIKGQFGNNISNDYAPVCEHHSLSHDQWQQKPARTEGDKAADEEKPAEEDSPGRDVLFDFSGSRL